MSQPPIVQTRAFNELQRSATMFKLRPMPVTPPAAIVIGASTGGPQALGALLAGLADHVTHVPVFVVLHMPADFNAMVASHIERQTGLPASVAAHGEIARPGRVYIAPGGLHLRVARSPEGARMWHSDADPEQFLRPAANFLFRSAASAYGDGLLGVVLTGMGADGLDGSYAIIARGGAVMAQDEASSVVWGMPGAVARAGLACAVAPLDELARRIARLLAARRAGGTIER